MLFIVPFVTGDQGRWTGNLVKREKILGVPSYADEPRKRYSLNYVTIPYYGFEFHWGPMQGNWIRRALEGF